MYEQEKREIINAGMLLDRYELIALSGGNVSLRIGEHVLVTPSGMIYEDLIEDDILVVDLNGNIIEGSRTPSVDTSALLYIFRADESVNAIIHTHQPYATAVGLIADELPCNVTTMANAVRGSVSVAPYTTAASEAMGVEAINYLNGRLAVILKHHGVIAVGDSLKQALYACIYLEEAAKTYTIARSMSGNPAMLTDKQIDQAVEVFKTYGQKPSRKQ